MLSWFQNLCIFASSIQALMNLFVAGCTSTFSTSSRLTDDTSNTIFVPNFYFIIFSLAYNLVSSAIIANFGLKFSSLHPTPRWNALHPLGSLHPSESCCLSFAIPLRDRRYHRTLSNMSLYKPFVPNPQYKLWYVAVLEMDEQPLLSNCFRKFSF